MKLVRTVYQSIIAHRHMLTGLRLNPMGISYRMSRTNVLVLLRLHLREADAICLGLRANVPSLPHDGPLSQVVEPFVTLEVNGTRCLISDRLMVARIAS